jgi:hypothetical protein
LLSSSLVPGVVLVSGCDGSSFVGVDVAEGNFRRKHVDIWSGGGEAAICDILLDRLSFDRCESQAQLFRAHVPCEPVFCYDEQDIVGIGRLCHCFYLYPSLLALDGGGGTTIALCHNRGHHLLTDDYVARRDSDVKLVVLLTQLDGVGVSVVVDELDLAIDIFHTVGECHDEGGGCDAGEVDLDDVVGSHYLCGGVC